MSEKRKCYFLILILLILGAASFIHKEFGYQIYSQESAQVKIADRIITLDEIEEKGFTCTGAVFDPASKSFYVGDAGKKMPLDEKFRAGIRQLSLDLNEQIRFFECYKQFESMRDIQGVAIDSTSNIWFCSYGENLVRCMDQNGNPINCHRVKNPSGIAYSSSDDTFWVLTNRYLIHFSREFNEICKFSFKVAGQDQLFYDEEQKIIYITAGNNYHGESYVYSFDVTNELFKLEYILQDSFAIEGITIINGSMYVFNDGLYHDAEIPVNQVNIYSLQ